MPFFGEKYWLHIITNNVHYMILVMILNYFSLESIMIKMICHCILFVNSTEVKDVLLSTHFWNDFPFQIFLKKSFLSLPNASKILSDTWKDNNDFWGSPRNSKKTGQQNTPRILLQSSIFKACDVTNISFLFNTHQEILKK